MKYYLGIEADDIAADLWAKHGSAGNILGNNQPGTAPRIDGGSDGTLSSPTDRGAEGA